MPAPASMEQPRTDVELVLRVRLARRALVLAGSVKDGSLGGLSGSMEVDASLASLIEDLREDYPAADLLEEFVRGVVIHRVGGAYRKLDGGKPHDGPAATMQVALALKVGGGDAQLLLVKGVGRQKGFLVGAQLRSAAPVPENFLSGLLGEITVRRLGVYYGSEAFPEVVPIEGEASAAWGPAPPALPPARPFARGLQVDAQILVGGEDLLEKLAGAAAAAPASTPAPAAPAPPPAQEAGEAKEALAKGTIHWFDVDKAIGPVTVRRVGLGYEKPRVAIRLDAGLQLSVLSLTLEGLGLSYPIDRLSAKPKEIWDNLNFHLDGASVAFSSGPLSIGGGLIKVPADYLQLDGFLVVRTGVFTISALGSYADMNGTPSLFVFAALQRALGGPAFFFVTGLALGFGINRALKLPDIRDVHNFPLLKAATDPDYLRKNVDPRAISQRLNAYISPQQGNFWLAAGVKFLSFGQIESFAMLSVAFGTRMEIALMGISRIRVPKLPPDVPEDDIPVLVYAEMAFKVAVSPAEGLLSFEARLTENSFVLRRDFRLRGGFAFYAWFAGIHEGDFVVSIGGYHPRFQVPAHYPRPDLVEFDCRIGETIAIRGHCYFALCPSAIMAGGGLSLQFQLGGIRAWFIAQADFLIQWKPLYYDIAISVVIGVALRIDIGALRVQMSAELSAAVRLYGPPLAGLARVSLWIVTIEIEFGEKPALPPPLRWEAIDADESFAKTFLPNPKVTSLTIAEGLLSEARNERGETTLSYVSPQKLVIGARTLVPVQAVRFNGHAPKRPDGTVLPLPVPTVKGTQVALGVRSMARKTFFSQVDVTLSPVSDASAGAKAYLAQYLEISLVTKSVPLALWGQPLSEAQGRKPPAADEQMADDALVGIEIRTRPGPRSWELPVIDLEVLAYDRFKQEPVWTMPKPADALPGFGDKDLARTVMDPEVAELRSAIVAGLRASGCELAAAEPIQLRYLADHAEHIFQAMPAMARVGQYPPRDYRNT